MNSDKISFHLLNYLLWYSDVSVTGLAAKRCEAALIEISEYHICPMFPVAIPHMKQASPLAIAVAATFRLTPLFNVIL
ncbi:MAG: hypothetical protein IKJ59_13825 [Clostridia bacterium]|nr:hypothetical protein [Clostridia bacterium]